MMATRAMFRVETRGENEGDKFIVFPDERANAGMVSIFHPADGHGEASIGWVQKSSRPARPGEFEHLQRAYEERTGETLTVAHRRSRRARDVQRDYVLTYGKSAVSHPHAMLGTAVREAKALSLPNSFGGEVAVVERHGYHTREIGRARRGSFFESSGRRDPRRARRRRT